MTSVLAGLTAVDARIAAACRRAGRPRSAVTLLAVSKGVDTGRLRQALAAGQRDFGESYLQEMQAKQAALAAEAPCWHFIGSLQSNKTAPVARRFAWAHAIERLHIAERLAAQRPEDAAPLSVCVQVNISAEPSKSGCAPADAAALCERVARLQRLRLRGLMAVPAPADDPAQSRPSFVTLFTLYERIRAAGAVEPGSFDTLSMGMSGDFEVAIEEGSTMVRVGTAIFGERPA